MPTAEISETARLSTEKDFYPLPEGAPIPSDEEIMETVKRRYEERQSRNAPGLTVEAYELAV